MGRKRKSSPNNKQPKKGTGTPTNEGSIDNNEKNGREKNKTATETASTAAASAAASAATRTNRPSLFLKERPNQKRRASNDPKQPKTKKQKTGIKNSKASPKTKHVERFWIEDCKETTADNKKVTADVRVLITRVQLVDNLLGESLEDGAESEFSKNSVENINLAEKKLPHSENKTPKTLDEEEHGDLEDGEHPQMCQTIDKPPKMEAGKIPEVEDANDEKRNFDSSKSVKQKTADDLDCNSGVSDSANSSEKNHNTPNKSFQPINIAMDENRAEQTSNSPTPEPTRITASANDQDGFKVDTPLLDGGDDDCIENTPKKGQPFICVSRANSAIGKLKWQMHPKKEFVPFSNGDCGDGITNPHPKSEVDDKYWAQRRRLFSKFDKGIVLDKEGWYSVTPEAIANHLADRLVQLSKTTEDGSRTVDKGAVVLDSFCGCGGNGISFARRPHRDISLVVCVDNDLAKLKMAAHNASIYHVDPNRIVFVQSDAIDILKQYDNGVLKRDKVDGDNVKASSIDTCCGYKIGDTSLLPPAIDVVFLSPPWGGMNYGKAGRRGFDLASCIQVHSSTVHDDTSQHDDDEEGNENAFDKPRRQITNGEELLLLASRAARDKLVIYFLPRNLNGISLGRAALKASYCGILEMEQNVLCGKLKTITVYLKSTDQKME